MKSASSLPHSQVPATLSRAISLQDTFWQWGVVSTLPNSQAGAPPFVDCPRLIQYIRSIHNGGRSSTRNLRTRRRGDMDPLTTVTTSDYVYKMFAYGSTPPVGLGLPLVDVSQSQ